MTLGSTQNGLMSLTGRCIQTILLVLIGSCVEISDVGHSGTIVFTSLFGFNRTKNGSTDL